MDSKTVVIWFKGLIAAAIGGGATSGSAWLGMAGAQAAGIDVPTLNLKALAVIFVSGALSSVLGYLKQSPIPRDESPSDHGIAAPLIAAFLLPMVLVFTSCATVNKTATASMPYIRPVAANATALLLNGAKTPQAKASYAAKTSLISGAVAEMSSGQFLTEEQFHQVLGNKLSAYANDTEMQLAITTLTSLYSAYYPKLTAQGDVKLYAEVLNEIALGVHDAALTIVTPTAK